MATSKQCKYCDKQIADNEDEVYICDSCCEFAHMACTQSERSPWLKGDHLFIYECRDCAYEKRDIFTRMKLSWVQVIHLALYNLTVTESGRQGFFRWKEDICEFIENNWLHLMSDREKTATWSGTIAGVLSVHSKLFKSGTHIFHENGWWSLHEVKPPNSNPENYKIYKTAPQYQMCVNKKKEGQLTTDYGRGKRQRKGKKRDNTNYKVPKVENEKVNDPMNGHGNNMENEHATLLGGLKIKTEESFGLFENNNLAKSTERIPLGGNLEFCDNHVVHKAQFGDHNQDISNLFNTSSHYPFLEENIAFSSDDNPFCLPFIPEDMSGDLPSLFNETSFNDINEVEEEISNTSGLLCENEGSENVLEEEEEEEPRHVKTLNNIVSLNVKEEMELFNKINESLNVLNADSCVRRLRRKLLVRKTKRQTNQKLFSLKEAAEAFSAKAAPNSMQITKADSEKKDGCDNGSAEPVDLSKKAYHHPALCDINVLDRFFCFRDNVENDSNPSSVHVRLVGNSEETICYRSIISPYTSRVLKPYIRRDFHALPCKLKLLREIKERDLKQGNQCKWPIDYCYVQPIHVPAVNALCSDFFWPGIDMTECLQYPEFSCIVLYRKLIIGFAFMVPDVKYNEAYISFILVHPDWQRAGIGSNMMYHLIQTCMGKDITLHVSPTNPSMMLYQKFGFKSEKLILGFYDKYLPENSNGCRHALLLRLRR